MERGNRERYGKERWVKEERKNRGWKRRMAGGRCMYVCMCVCLSVCLSVWSK